MSIYLQKPERRKVDAEVVHTLVFPLLVMTVIALSNWCKGKTQCHFRQLTGQPCPTCGATRLVEASLAGECRTALRMNPLLASVAAALFLGYPYAMLVTIGRLPRVRATLKSASLPLFIVGGMVLLLANWLFLILDGR